MGETYIDVVDDLDEHYGSAEGSAPGQRRAPHSSPNSR